MVFHVIPGIGTEEAKFGEKREDIRKRFGWDYASFRRGGDPKIITEKYSSLGVFFLYNNENVLVAMEFFYGASVIYCDVDIMECKFQEIIDMFRSKDGNVIEDITIAKSNVLRMAIWNEQLDDPERKPETFFIYSELYEEVDEGRK